MNRAVYIRGSSQIGSVVNFSIDSKNYKFDTKINFSDAIIFTEKNVVVVVHSKLSSDSTYVGALFDFDGNKLFDIPYPNLGNHYSHLVSKYSWSSAIDDGVKMVFMTDSVSYGDFWIDFLVDDRTYGASGTSR